MPNSLNDIYLNWFRGETTIDPKYHEYFKGIETKSAPKNVGENNESVPKNLHMLTPKTFKTFTSYNDCLTNPQTPAPESSSERREIVDSLENIEVNAENFAFTQEEISAPTNVDSVYRRYDFKDHEYGQDLPIVKHKEEILSAIAAYPVTIVHGSTGCGKSSQIPQYIIDEAASLNKECRIIITQPRKLAAIGLAQRVSQERKWPIGTLVGYKVQLHSNTCDDTRIFYVTTGILLALLVGCGKDLGISRQTFSHIILDEVHERTQEVDLILAIIKVLLHQNKIQSKVIIMSATIDIQMFTNYFSVKVGNENFDAKSLRIQGNRFNVEEYFLEDLNACLGIEVPPSVLINLNKEVSIPDEMYAIAGKIISCLDILETKSSLSNDPENYCEEANNTRDSVLVFLPGILEIKRMKRYMEEYIRSYQLDIFLLYSELPIEEQLKVFKKSSWGVRKVILATNLAESSITLPDIKYVIDFCLHKQLVSDKSTNFNLLELAWASKVNCVQRRGRVGRCSSGVVFKLITSAFYKESIQSIQTPEILRCSMESVILKVKKLGLKNPLDMLKVFLNPPNFIDVEKSLMKLKEVGALTLFCEGEADPYDGNLTFLGRVACDLPLDVRLTKLILFGHLFDCLNDCVIIAASLSLKNFFVNYSRTDAFCSYRSKMKWANSSFCDFTMTLNAYKAWKHKKELNSFCHPNPPESTWSRKMMLHADRLNECSLLIADLHNRLRTFNIFLESDPFAENNAQPKSDKHLRFKLCMAAAFYPHFFLQSAVDMNEASMQLEGLSPLSSVMLSGLPSEDAPMYSPQIEKFLQHISHPYPLKYFFISGRVYVEFPVVKTYNHHNSSLDGISPSIYEALFLKKTSQPLKVHIYPKSVSTTFMEKVLEENIKNNGRLGFKNILVTDTFFYTRIDDAEDEIDMFQFPELKSHFIDLKILHFDFNKSDILWVMDANKADQLEEIVASLNGPSLKPLPSFKCKKNAFCIAQYNDFYYRAKIMEHYPEIDKVSVFFIDYGNWLVVKAAELKEMPYDLMKIRSLVFPSRLWQTRFQTKLVQNTKSSHYIDEDDIGSECSTNNLLKKIICDRSVTARVMSVVNGLATLILYDGVYKHELSMQAPPLNAFLIKNKYCSFKEETKQLRTDLNNRVYSFKQGKNIDPDFSWNMLNLEDIPDRDKFSAFDTKTVLGPSSPLEATIKCLTNSGSFKPVSIDQSSVNFVNLSTTPLTSSPCILIASNIRLSSSNKNMLISGVSMFPSVSGMLEIFCSTLAPLAQLIHDREEGRCTSLIAGLGPDFFPEHDLNIELENDLTEKDLRMINDIRTIFNMYLAHTHEKCLDINVVKRYLNELMPRYKHLLFQRYQCSSKPKQYTKSNWKYGLKNHVENIPAHNLGKIIYHTLL